MCKQLCRERDRRMCTYVYISTGKIQTYLILTALVFEQYGKWGSVGTNLWKLSVAIHLMRMVDRTSLHEFTAHWRQLGLGTLSSEEQCSSCTLEDWQIRLWDSYELLFFLCSSVLCSQYIALIKTFSSLTCLYFDVVNENLSVKLSKCRKHAYGDY